MKTPITLRSTLSNTSWTQRGAVALLVAALMFALTLALQPNAHVPASAPAVRQAAPAARNPNVPINDTGSAYDGQSHQQAWVAAFHATHSSPIQSVASSAYDGQAYPAVRPVVRNTPIRTAASSAYDGQSHRSAAPAVRVASPSAPIQSAASSAYNGQAYRSPHPVTVSASPALIGTGSAYDGR